MPGALLIASEFVNILKVNLASAETFVDAQS